MSHVCNHKGSVLDAEVGMWKVRQHGHHLIVLTECRDERANGFAAT